MSEETTKGLFQKRIRSLGYPQNQDVKEDGIIWYKEDSYKDIDKNIAKKFAKASKSLSNKSDGRPDFTIDTNKGWIIVVECKESVSEHSSKKTLSEYIGDIGTKEDIQKYAINGALHYATYVNDNKDVIAIGYSGTSECNVRATSFVLPKGGTLNDIKLIEDGEFFNTITNVNDYIKTAETKLGRHLKESQIVLNELSSYAVTTANYLRANKISATDRAGFISAVVLALTNENSQLFKLTKKAIEDKETKKSRTLEDLIGASAIDELKKSLKDIWENIDDIPDLKKETLEEFYNKLLVKSLLSSPDGLDKCKKYYKYGENVLSCCIYSVYENIIVPLKKHTELDIMGTFYTVFLRHASGDAKDKGIVLTPKHITELFCDIAEFYLGKKLDNTTKVIDICCGTGGFLISALNRMDNNIDSLTISNDKKKNFKDEVRNSCLIGIENDPSMFALAYANMRFHGDGKSNLYSCSSLLKDLDEKGIVDYNKGNPINLKDELINKNKGDVITSKNEELSEITVKYTDISVGMINPPYSTDSQTDKKKEKKQSGASELDFVYSMLSYLKVGGIGIAIVPMSCASKKGKNLRKLIMKEHTLLACMTMPKNLFQDSHVGTSTCIMVFKAHVPHKDSNKTVFMARWAEDGFITIPHHGRIDRDENHILFKSEWIKQLKGTAKPDETVFLRKEITSAEDECLAEAHILTDYSKLNEEPFISALKRYSLHKYAIEKIGVFLEPKDMTMWLIDNYDAFNTIYRPPFDDNNKLQLKLEEFKDFLLYDYFDINYGRRHDENEYGEGETPYISATSMNNGIGKEISLDGDYPAGCITTEKINSTAFYQPYDFCATNDVNVYNPWEEYKNCINIYNAFFIVGMINFSEGFRWCYGRQVRQGDSRNVVVKLPAVYNDTKDKYEPNWQFMEDYIKSLPYSKNL